MNTYYVYVYKDPDTLIPFYVGMGKGKRYLSHLNHARANPTPKQGEHKSNKIRKILRSSKEPIIDFIITDSSREDAKKEEIRLISLYGRDDLGTGPLTNLTGGGDGGISTQSDPIYKQKRSAAATERWADPSFREFMSLRNSEFVDKMKDNQAYKDKKKTFLGRTHKQSTIAKQSESALNKPRITCPICSSKITPHVFSKHMSTHGWTKDRSDSFRMTYIPEDTQNSLLVQESPIPSQ